MATGVEIAGPRIRLRELAEGDAPGLERVYGDRDVTRHLTFPPRSPEQCADVVGSAMSHAAAEPRTIYLLAAVDGTDTLIGVGRLGIDEHPHSGQIGFVLRADTRGRGVGGELVRLLLRLGFEELGLSRIWGARSPENAASQRVMAGAGMVEEGRIRRHVRSWGAWRDSVVHAILDDEWQPEAPSDVRG
ncbi:GNAT family N-acetyltransferase [Streptomonospora salina]|uniref:RimJ/RimL family protein N-acetyltransferase n=1 Tax=Streptomonospora salina TaxID=104205 RepID=A0A841EKB9_9ACTN|nr:GNAT family protein [Streptomonospora salina]MBB5999861.1 RimJ/RimL family protein N-acetyltransferase [Streptomonospora salina]